MITPTGLDQQEVSVIASMACTIHAAKLSVINSYHEDTEHCDCQEEAFTLYENVVRRVALTETVRRSENE